MAEKPSPHAVCSRTDTHPLPDLGTLWTHDKHGLVMLTGIKELASTSFGQTLYTVHVYRLKDDFHTEGIFGMSDWHAQFTLVA